MAGGKQGTFELSQCCSCNAAFAASNSGPTPSNPTKSSRSSIFLMAVALSGFNPFFLVLAQEYAGDVASARATAQQLLPSLETLCQKDPDNPNFPEALSIIRAVLGQKDAAIKEAERAITLLPTVKDAVAGPVNEENLAFVEVLVGDKDRAIPRLQHLLQVPYNNCLTPALLKLHPQWDPLRADPAFRKLCEEKNR